MNPIAPIVVTGIVSIPIMGITSLPDSASGPFEFGVYATLVVCMAIAVRVLYKSIQEKDKQIIDLVESSIKAHQESVAEVARNNQSAMQILSLSNEILQEVRRTNENLD